MFEKNLEQKEQAKIENQECKDKQFDSPKKDSQ